MSEEPGRHCKNVMSGIPLEVRLNLLPAMYAFVPRFLRALICVLSLSKDPTRLWTALRAAEPGAALGSLSTLELYLDRREFKVEVVVAIGQAEFHCEAKR